MFEKTGKVFTDSAYREKLFLETFNNPRGEELMEWLEYTFQIATPDFENPHSVYYRLGKQAALNYIKTVVNNAKQGE